MPGLEKRRGHVRSDVHCTACSKTFVTLLDYDTDGHHRIICPYCGHEHWRTIKAGEITEERAPDRTNTSLPIIDVSRKSTWPTRREDRYNSTVSAFIRDAWLNRGGDGSL